MKKLLVGIAVAATMTLTACGSAPTKTSAAADSYEGKIAQAKKLHAESASHGNVWKQKKMKKAYVDHYVAKSAEAKAKGDDKAAMKWADEALKTAKAQLQQYNDNNGLEPLWRKTKK